ncbi:TetR/AcrR family transcriptional regulator [Couchioplanes caeruleus]|uniref:TetR/AcrR family transcriptional regulator n=1 Tax=Couchioplanes caeruleus TaxID=56438 RepID=UPI0020C0C8EF|nr:TetR/AcrR family transcriptional regulator [Couchioplanes caeruleus]UQU65569.1 TetR/AcrR family transcriptional regulator [Couchioplanes caeruleus]
MPRVSEEHLTARREQILAAARACFLRRGLHNTSMQDLIQEAGLSVGAVYRYFKSKNEIINAISQTVAGGLAAVLTEIAAEEDLSLVDSLSRVLDVIDEQVAPGGNFPLAIQVWSEATLDPAIAAIVRERYLELRQPFRVIAKRAAARGELAADADPEAVAATLFGFIPAYATQRQLVGSPDKETFLSGVRALLTR